MVYYHGVLDYYILKKNGQSVILLLDNHDSEKYCNFPAENINELLLNFLQENKATIILEEIYGDIKYQKLFNLGLNWDIIPILYL